MKADMSRYPKKRNIHPTTSPIKAVAAQESARDLGAGTLGALPRAGSTASLLVASWDAAAGGAVAGTATAGGAGTAGSGVVSGTMDSGASFAAGVIAAALSSAAGSADSTRAPQNWQLRLPSRTMAPHCGQAVATVFSSPAPACRAYSKTLGKLYSSRPARQRNRKRSIDGRNQQRK
jgi:hypothetical protein